VNHEQLFEAHKRMGYSVYFLFNTTPVAFKSLVPVFLKQTKAALTIFFTGHGANVRDRSGDEADGKDEALVFDNGHILDDDMLHMLKENANGKAKVLVLTDCCHSGSIWDLQSAHAKSEALPPNIVSLSAAHDDQTAKQTTINKGDQGIFTHFLWEALEKKPSLTPRALEAVLNPSLAKYNQKYVPTATSDALLDRPVFDR
jgi:uncharacterized caspase-like protein